ncbi:MAG: Rrf2 family transcriptional regulator [Pseudomonadota bacterium]
MSRSQKFPVAVHTLVALAIAGDEFLSSETLARSIDTNPVVVRRILQALKKAGLVCSRGGVYGGASLCRPADEITLLEVCDAVEEPGRCEVHGAGSDCWIAHGIRATIPDILEDAEAARRRFLAARTIGELAVDVRTHRGAA